MPLYRVQDSDRPMYVLATSWTGALHAWQNQMAKENLGTDPGDHEVQGIEFVAEGNDLLVTIEVSRDIDDAFACTAFERQDEVKGRLK